MTGFITGLKSVEEVEAGIFEVVVTLQRGATAKLRMNTFTFQAFVTKFIEGPRPERWLDKPIYLLKKILCAFVAFAKTAITALELTHAPCETISTRSPAQLSRCVVPNLHFLQSVKYSQGKATAGSPADDRVFCCPVIEETGSE